MAGQLSSCMEGSKFESIIDKRREWFGEWSGYTVTAWPR